MNLFVDYEEYSGDLHTILFKSEGKDTQFWAGNYGPKTTGSSLIFDISED